MRVGYKWANESFRLTYTDGKVEDKANQACYSTLMTMGNGNLHKITIFNTKCDKTKEYHDEYLKYLTDMLKLDSIITNNSFEFTAYTCNVKNLLVCSLVRLLYEKIGNKSPAIDTHTVFLEPLLRTGKSKYRNKLKRFCDFYKTTLGDYGLKYWHDGHSWNPYKTLIKSTQDFLNTDNLKTVNGFFTK